jgi:AcrR family transcriptional regulator
MSVNAVPAKPARAAQKGQQTKAVIVDAALALAAQIGLEGLSIGAVAEITKMSKSGVFAHFGSREELQISVVREYHARFEQEVFFPALSAPRGLPRLRAMFANWMKRTSTEIDSGCIYISGASEFDDRPGPVRDALVESVSIWQAAVLRAIVQSQSEGHLRADADERQVAFEIHGSSSRCTTKPASCRCPAPSAARPSASTTSWRAAPRPKRRQTRPQPHQRPPAGA